MGIRIVFFSLFKIQNQYANNKIQIDNAGHDKVVDYLIQNGANVGVWDESGETALHIAG